MRPKGQIVMFYIKLRKEWVKSFVTDWEDTFYSAIKDYLYCIDKDHASHLNLSYDKKLSVKFETESFNDYKEIPVFRTFEFEEDITEEEFDEFKKSFMDSYNKIHEKIDHCDINVPKNLIWYEDGELIFDIGDEKYPELRIF